MKHWKEPYRTLNLLKSHELNATIYGIQMWKISPRLFFQFIFIGKCTLYTFITRTVTFAAIKWFIHSGEGIIFEKSYGGNFRSEIFWILSSLKNPSQFEYFFVELRGVINSKNFLGGVKTGPTSSECTIWMLFSSNQIFSSNNDS